MGLLGRAWALPAVLLASVACLAGAVSARVGLMWGVCLDAVWCCLVFQLV